MKKQAVSILLSASVAAALLAGCGGSSSSTSAASASSAASSASETAASSSSSTSAATSSSSTEEVASSSAAETAASSSSSSETKAVTLDPSDPLKGTQFENTKANGDYNFSVIVKSFQATYWQAAIQGMDKAKEELGINYTAQGPNTESDVADQVNMLNSAINNKPDGIALAACDTSAVLKSLQTAKDNGVPVVTFDTGVNDAPEGSVLCDVSTDCKTAGSLAAEKMYDALKDKIANATSPVRIGEVNQDATAKNIQDRGLGFINKLAELCKADGKTVAVTGNEFYVNNCDDKGDESTADVIIEVSVPAQTTVELCSTEAQTILSKEDTIGIFGSNQVSAEGVLAADANLSCLGSDPETDVIGIGFDAGSTIKAAVTDGTFIGAVTQSPLMMGYYAIYAMTAIANGDTVEDMPMPGYWYDSTNMDDPTIKPNLYD
jgi:ribose transport system substrate-binding protein